MSKIADSVLAMDGNACAYQLLQRALPHLKKWKPAIKNNEKIESLFSFYFAPSDLYENYQKGYVPIYEIPKFNGREDGGIRSFREEIIKKINMNGFQWKENFRVEVGFVVTKEGTIEKVNMIQSSGLPDFDKRIVSGIESIRKKWIPAKINGKSVSYHFRLPLTFAVR